MSRTMRSFLPLVIGSLAVILFDAGCARDTVGPTSPDAPTLARGGKPGGGGGAEVVPTVAAVDPDSASQDTTLDVLVYGKDFDDGSRAEWLISGTPNPSPRIQTNSTTYVNSMRLIANITIAADAEPTTYDVQVTSSKGRKGIGIEKFAVKEKLTSIPVDATLRDAAGDGVRSDGAGLYAAAIDALGNLFLDARVSTERQICFDFGGQPNAPSADPFCDAGWISTFDVSENGGLQQMGVGGTLSVRLGVSWVKDRYNWALAFGRDCLSGDVLTSDLDVVTKSAPGTWVIEGSSATLCRAPTKGKPSSEKVGSFVLPHRLTLEQVLTP